MAEQTLLKTVTQVFSEAELSHLSNHGNGRQPQQCPPSASGPTWSTEVPLRLSVTNCVCVCVSDPGVYDEVMQPVFHSGFLYKFGSTHRGTLSRRTREGGQSLFSLWRCSVDLSRPLWTCPG